MLPKLNVIMTEEDGIPDIGLVTFDDQAAWADYNRIMKECGDELSAEDVAGMERSDLEHEYVEVDGKWYHNQDQYGSVHARIFGVDIDGTADISFGSYFQGVLSALASKHDWEDPYAMISPGNHNGRWIDKILTSFLFNVPQETVADEIYADNMANGSK
jgi:hypothetical protein